jgi:putative glutamine amidotransferase
MSSPLIGITTYGRDEKNNYPLPAEYVESVRRAGGIPVLIPPGESLFQELLSIVQGIILSGGGDIDPRCYGGKQTQTTYMVDEERDKSELALVEAILESQKPALGICRGTQVINTVLGGTLIEHIPDEIGETVKHRLPPREPAEHEVIIKTGSRLAKILRQTRVVTASVHHQAIRKVAPGLEVVAEALDGTIEAVEMKEHPWLIAVQWHPELTSARDPIQQKLFDALVQTTGKFG